jgi:arylsulfatase A-like enzyme
MQAYAAAPIGRPSRSALQSGLHPVRTKHGELGGNYETLGELAKRAGLKTAHIGKWQLGTGKKSPAAQGYDHVFAANESHPDSYYHPFFTEQPQADLLAESQPGDYLTDKLTDHAIDLLDQWRDSTWLLSLNYYAPHVPLEGRKDQVAAYRALIDSTHWRKFPTLQYAAMVSVIDENIGRIVELLRENGQLENTLIVFTSDNGGLDRAAEGKLLAHTPPTDNGILRGGKGTLYEGGIRVPFIVHFTAYATTRFASLEQVIGTDVFPSVGQALSQGDYAASPDGRSFLPLLRGEPARRRPLFWAAPYDGPEGPASAIRQGNFKLYRDETVDSLTYFNLGALPDESLRMALPPGEVDLLKALETRELGARN